MTYTTETLPSLSNAPASGRAERNQPFFKPEWVRLPPPKGRCPYTGLSRALLNSLILPMESNGNVPPVKSVVLRKRGNLRGVRLISYDSLMAYIASFEDKAAANGSPS